MHHFTALWKCVQLMGFRQLHHPHFRLSAQTGSPPFALSWGRLCTTQTQGLLVVGKDLKFWKGFLALEITIYQWGDFKIYLEILWKSSLGMAGFSDSLLSIHRIKRDGVWLPKLGHKGLPLCSLLNHSLWGEPGAINKAPFWINRNGKNSPQKPCDWVILEEGTPAPFKSSDDVAPTYKLDCDPKRDPQFRTTQVSHSQISDLQKLWDNEYVLSH